MIPRMEAASQPKPAEPKPIGLPARLKPQRAMRLKPHRLPDGSCVEPVIILDCETTAPIRVEGAEICYLKETA